ncbi:MAG: hypothetical protein QNI84_01380 [Henriciella sp.]|nr:hypothetical protein [Henriciella sp.]
MIRASLFSLSLITAFAAPAVAEGLTASQTVELAMVSEDENGERQVIYTIADEIAPGSELRYVLSYDNQADVAATDVRLVMPVPTEITLIEGSADQAVATVTYSADNGATFTSRDSLTVLEDGELKPASTEDITHLRWTFAEAIAPGASGKLTYSGILQ